MQQPNGYMTQMNGGQNMNGQQNQNQGMHGAFNPNFNQMNGQQAQRPNQMNGFTNNRQQQPQQSNNGGWVGFNTQQNGGGGGNDFLSQQGQAKASSKNSILGKYHSKPSNQFMTSLPGQQQQPNMMGMNGMGMNQMGMNG